MKDQKIRTFNDLTKREIQELVRNAQQDEVTKSVPLLSETDDPQSCSAFWLHARIKRDCYYFCSTYSYSVWTSTDQAGKEKIEVEEIILRIRRHAGKVDYINQRSNTSHYKHIEEVYGQDNNRGDTVLTATVKLFGSTWNVEVNF